MPVTPSRDVPLRDVALWCLQRRQVLPAPLAGGETAQVRLTDDDVIDAVAERPGGAPAHPLDDAAELLLAPQWCFWSGRTGSDGASTLVVGLVRGGDAVVVTESAQQWSVDRVPAAEVVEAVLTRRPGARPARLRPLRLSRRALAELAERTRRTGSARSGLDTLAARGGDAEAVAVLERVDRSATARGLLGSMTYDTDGAVLPDSGVVRWVESPAGAVLVTDDDEGTAAEAADDTAVRRAAGRLAEQARRRVVRPVATETRGVGVR